MKLSMTLNYSGDPRAAADEAAQLERAGVDVGWVAELYSFDAVSILGYLAAKTETMGLGSAIMPITRSVNFLAGSNNVLFWRVRSCKMLMFTLWMSRSRRWMRRPSARLSNC